MTMDWFVDDRHHVGLCHEHICIAPSLVSDTIHAFMQHAYDSHSLLEWQIEDDVGLMRVAPDVPRELRGASSKHGIFSEVKKARFRRVTRAADLFEAELLQGVIGDPSNVMGGARR